jgi:hypothetical protein
VTSRVRDADSGSLASGTRGGGGGAVLRDAAVMGISGWAQRLVVLAWVAAATAAAQDVCSAPASCAEGAVCLRAVGQCGGEGSCVSDDFLCPDIYAPACGCDGHSYVSPCEAQRQGGGAARHGACCVGSCSTRDQVTREDPRLPQLRSRSEREGDDRRVGHRGRQRAARLSLSRRARRVDRRRHRDRPSGRPRHQRRMRARSRCPYGQPAPPDAQSGDLPRMFIPATPISFSGTPTPPPS